jgi:hypothetical protein
LSVPTKTTTGGPERSGSTGRTRSVLTPLGTTTTAGREVSRSVATAAARTQSATGSDTQATTSDAASCAASAERAASSSTSTRWVRCSSTRGALTSRTVSHGHRDRTCSRTVEKRE